MLSGARILVTGPSGQIALPLVRALVAAGNDVWGVARFGDPAARARLDALGVTTRAVDLAEGDYGDLPTDFTHLLHLAAYQGADADYDHALRVNAEATGLILAHCRRATSALVMSTQSVYRAHEDPWHVFSESDPLGDPATRRSPTYSVAKLGQEAVARTCARLFDLPVTIARMNASYGPGGGLLTYHLAAVLAGTPVTTRWDPCPYSPIHDEDIAAGVGPLLHAAGVPATIVNWGGDRPVTVQQWCEYAAGLAGVTARIEVVPEAGSLRGSVADPTRRQAITGPCRVDWRDGVARVLDALRAAGQAR